MDPIIERILNSFDAEQVIPGNEEFPNQICLLNTTNVFGREQPVVVEIRESQFETNLKVVSLKTPLGNETVVDQLIQSYSLFEFPYEEEFLMVKMCMDIEHKGDFHVYMQIQLPIFTTEEGIELLSKYEINEALKDLTECADLIERYATGDQDLTIDAGTVSERQQVTSKSLRDTIFQEKLNKRWQFAFNRKYVYLNKEKKDLKKNCTSLWALNHNNQFVKYLYIHSSLVTSLAFFSKDIQQKEQSALEHHFDALCGNSETEQHLRTNKNVLT